MRALELLVAMSPNLMKEATFDPTFLVIHPLSFYSSGYYSPLLSENNMPRTFQGIYFPNITIIIFLFPHLYFTILCSAATSGYPDITITLVISGR